MGDVCNVWCAVMEQISVECGYITLLDFVFYWYLLCFSNKTRFSIYCGYSGVYFFRIHFLYEIRQAL